MSDWADNDIVVYDKGDDIFSEKKLIPGLDFEMPEDVEVPSYGLDLPFVLGKSRDRKTGPITKVQWTPDHFYPAGIAHRFLWLRLIQTSDFMMETMGVIDTGQQARWREVERYVLTGEK